MPIIGDVRIKVDSAVLNAKAQSVSNSIRIMNTYLEQLEMIVSRTSYYWIGEAGNMHRKLYKDQKSQINEMMKRLKEHPEDLMKIAQTYNSAESAVQSMAAELPGDIIS